MSNPKRKPKDYVPSHLGTQSRGFSGNKGKQMQVKSRQNVQVIQTKGE